MKAYIFVKHLLLLIIAFNAPTIFTSIIKPAYLAIIKTINTSDTYPIAGSSFVSPLQLIISQQDLKLITLVFIFSTLLLSLITFAIFCSYKTLKRETQLLRSKESAIRDLAFQDYLTGISNRHHFFVLAEQALKGVIRRGTKAAVLFIDLDNFKQINDQLGHQAGDQILIHVAQTLRGMVRESDIVARLGGDEFVVLLDNIDNLHDIDRTLNDLNETISKPFPYRDRELMVKASIGYAVFPKDGINIEALLDSADDSMYKIKNRSKLSQRLQPEYFAQNIKAIR